MFSGLLRLSQVTGGVKPSYHKADSAALPIETLPLPERLILPLRQHAGSDAIPIVKPGDKVLKGQLIALPPSEVSAPVHASSSGEVIEITDVPAPHPSGLTAKAIIIKCDGYDRWLQREPLSNPYHTPALELAQRVSDAGIVGMGGAIFPAAVKLKQGTRHEIKTVIVNGSECEPYLTCDDRLMRERARDIVEGAKLIHHILRAFRVVIAIEDNKPEALAAISAAAERHGMIEVQEIPTRYPMGSAKQLIQEVTGQEVPAGGRSTSVGVLVHNVGTVYAIQQALVYGRPLISRVVTVAGGSIKTPRNVEARVGTPVQDLFNFCGGFTEQPAKFILGGPMMGQPLNTTDVPLIKGATGVLALTKAELPKQDTAPCIRCGRCVDACPMGLLPLDMAAHSRVDDFDGADEAGLKDCILCGSCAFVCPSHIPLVQYFQYAKGEQDSNRKTEKKLVYTAELARERDQRLEAEAAAKAAAKAAKKAKKKRSTASKSTTEESSQ